MYKRKMSISVLYEFEADGLFVCTRKRELLKSK